MEEYTETKCPECGQRLRVPKGIGGIQMECPSCGRRLYSDFKIKGQNENDTPLKKLTMRKKLIVTIFELPTTTLAYLKRLFFS